MVSAVTLGTFFNFNGRNILGGVGGSGLDVEALLNSLVAVRSAPATIVQQKVTENNAVKAKLAEFSGLLSTFNSVAYNLSNPAGVGNDADNAFAYNSTSVSSNTSIAGSNYVSVTAEPGVQNQSFNITYITSRAAIGKQASGTFTVATADTAGLVVASGAVAGQFNAGTFSLNGLDGGPDANITLEETDTLNSIIQKFNNVALQTGIAASLVTIDDGEYAISFTAIQSGADYGFDLENVSTVTSDPDGVLSQIAFSTTSVASNAEFIIDGIEISRPTNIISDVIDGVTFNILQITPDDPMSPPPTPTTITVEVSVDTATARSSIIAFADAYNALKQFEAKQLKLKDDGTFDSTAVLATNQLFRTTMNSITNQVLSVVSGLTDGHYNDPTDFGMTFANIPETTDSPEVRNILSIDDDVLSTALEANFDQVRRVFEFTFNSDNANLQVFSRTNALATTAFTLEANPYATQETENISVADADTQIAYTTPADGQLGIGDITINGVTITIADGDTLNQVAQKFNDETADTGVTATVTEVSAGTFKLTFTSVRQTGEVNFFNLKSTTVDADGIFDNISITATGSYEATYDNGAGPVTIDMDGEEISGGGGFILTGQDGTVLQGLRLIYSSEAASESDVSLSQGIGDKLYNFSNDIVETDGAIDTEVDSINDDNERLSDQIERISEQVDRYREVLVLKFTALEQAISNVNNILASLNANDQARRLANGG